MKLLKHLFDKNREWAAAIEAESPGFFEKLSGQQAPEYLWIGCADSRVPANEIVGLLPGELFVHRNVANVVVQTDFNCLSVIQYAVDVLKVKHIIVCGHYGCGGVAAAMGNESHGLIDNWLHPIRNLYEQSRSALELLEDDEQKLNAMCELNVVEQVAHVCHTTVVQSAWKRGQELSVHGWIYGLADGHLRDLNVTVESLEQVPPIFRVTDNIDGGPVRR